MRTRTESVNWSEFHYGKVSVPEQCNIFHVDHFHHAIYRNLFWYYLERNKLLSSSENLFSIKKKEVLCEILTQRHTYHFFTFIHLTVSKLLCYLERKPIKGNQRKTNISVIFINTNLSRIFVFLLVATSNNALSKVWAC